MVAYADVIQGPIRVKERFAQLKAQGYRYAVVDATDNSQLAVLAEAVSDLKLVTGGSGLGAYMALSIKLLENRFQCFCANKRKNGGAVRSFRDDE